MSQMIPLAMNNIIQIQHGKKVPKKTFNEQSDADEMPIGRPIGTKVLYFEQFI